MRAKRKGPVRIRPSSVRSRRRPKLRGVEVDQHELRRNVEKLTGPPGVVVNHRYPMLAKSWVCDNCGKVYRAKLPQRHPLDCDKCGGGIFSTPDEVYRLIEGKYIEI